MSRFQATRHPFKSLMSVGLILFVVFLSGCEVLATEGARDAIAGQREVRAIEDRELGPLEQEMNDLFVTEIQPREVQIEDLRYKKQVYEDELLRPLWDAQGDAWAPGGEASEAQMAFQARYHELDLLQRSIEIEQRELDSKWQDLWGVGATADPEFQALEDLRYEKQRELDHAYRFGNRHIEDIWNEINELNSTQNWGNTDSQIQSEEINQEVNRLYDQYNELLNAGSGEAALLEEKERAIQEELDTLYNRGWDPIYKIWGEIDRLEGERARLSATAGNDESIRALIADLENLKAGYVVSRDAEVASLLAAQAAAEDELVETETTTFSSGSNDARIAELELLIQDLEGQSAVLLVSKQSEIDSLDGQITEKTNSYGELIDSTKTDFLTLSASLLAQAASLDTQIDELIEANAEGSAEQIADLEVQRDALIAQEELEETTFHDSVTQFELERDAGVAEIKSSIDALEAEIDDGLTDAIDNEIAGYNTELDDLRSSSVVTTVLVTNTTESTDIQASIDSTEAYWNNLIQEADIEILELNSHLGLVTVDDSTDARINNLRLQAADLELALNTRIADLEGIVNELFRQANNAGSGSSAGLDEVQSQIDALNHKLELIWQQESSNGLNILRQVQALEEQARTLNDEFQVTTRALEEELWDIDDRLSVFYRDQESGHRTVQVGYETEMALLQRRRIELEEQRWTLELEERATFDEIEAKNAEAIAEIKAIEDGDLSEIRTQIRELELELRGFYATQREIEIKMDEARRLVEDKQREIEDNLLDLLDAVAGVETDSALSADADNEPDGTIPEISGTATPFEVAD